MMGCMKVGTFAIFDCRNSHSLRDSSCTSMLWLPYGQRSCLLQLGVMPTERFHRLRSHLLTLLSPATWLEVQLWELVQLKCGRDMLCGKLFFFFCWWKLKCWDASMKLSMFLTIALLHACISLVISPDCCKASSFFHSPFQSTFLAIAFYIRICFLLCYIPNVSCVWKTYFLMSTKSLFDAWLIWNHTEFVAFCFVDLVNIISGMIELL